MNRHDLELMQDRTSRIGRMPARLLGVVLLAPAALTTATSGCSGSGTQPDTNDPPSASFTFSPESPFAEEGMVFQSTSSDPDGDIVSESWDFGNGVTGSGTSIAHAFDAAGTYTVSLTVTDDGGAHNTVTRQVDVSPALALAAIAGPWYGGLTPVGFSRVLSVVSVTVRESLQGNRIIALVKHWHRHPAAVCEGVWRVTHAQGQRYEVEESTSAGNSGACPEGTVIIDYDEESGGLGYAQAEAGLAGILTPADSVSFSLIAGDWSGTGVDQFEEFWIRARLHSNAVQGQSIGQVEYGTGDPQTDPLDCIGDWIALEAEGNLFQVAERIVVGSVCPHGTVRLEYDPGTGRLEYEFVDWGDGTANATGELTRE